MTQTKLETGQWGKSKPFDIYELSLKGKKKHIMSSKETQPVLSVVRFFEKSMNFTEIGIVAHPTSKT